MRIRGELEVGSVMRGHDNEVAPIHPIDIAGCKLLYFSEMFNADQYELVDFGRGRKLERFGSCLLDRPCPQAEGIEPAEPAAWKQATARFERTQADRGTWLPTNVLPATWQVRHGAVCFQIAPTEFGHLGIFPEQAANWDWIAEQMQSATQPPRILNLFAYTGGSTLAAVAAGASVTHVDSAKNTVAWARRNAALSKLESAPIRWLIEDAARFVGRELKRDRQYDAIILDPPSYGHGPSGEVWKLTEDLPELLRQCVELTAGQPRFILLTCHSTGITAGDAREWLSQALKTMNKKTAGKLSSGDMALATSAGRQLASGVFARWSV